MTGNKTKGAAKSLTVWGVAMALAATVAEASGVLEGIVGAEAAGRIVAIAGLVVAFIGRVRASTQIRGLMVLALAAMPVLLGGCANPPSRGMSLTGEIDEATTPASTAQISNEVWQASYPGAEPSMVLADADGLQVVTSQIGTAGSIPEVVTFWSPGDVTLEEATANVNPDGTWNVTIRGYSTTLSSTISAYNARVELTTGLLAGMSRDEAQRYVDSLVEAGSITESVAEAALRAAFP